MIEESAPAKDFQQAFTRKLSSYTEKPEEGAKFLVKKNLKDLITKSLKDANEFTHTNFVKQKSLAQLQHIIVLGEELVQEYAKDIIKTLVKYLDYELETEIPNTVKKISQLLGIYIPTQVYVPLVLNMINDEENKTAPKSLTKLLIIFSLMIKAESPKTIESFLESIMRVVSSVEKSFEESEDVLSGLYAVVRELIAIAGENVSIYCRPIFSLLLTVQAMGVQNSANAKNTKEDITHTMMELAKYCGYTSVAELHANEVSMLLNEFAENKTYKTWQKYTKDRLKFEIIVRNCGEGLARFMSVILEILQSCVELNQDLEVRMDALVLVEFIISLEFKDVREKLEENSQLILTKILIPSIVWKIGKPQIKIRKAGIINIYKLIENDLVSAEVLMRCFKELMPPIKSCLSDDWAPDLRLATCKLVERLFLSVRDLLEHINISENYQLLLERLDDSQDVIRTEIFKTFTILFAAPALKESPAIFEYMAKAIFIHLDDQNEDVQLGAYSTLKMASRFNPKKIKQEGEIALKKMKYPRKCQEIISNAEELIKESIQEEQQKNQESTQ